MILQAAAQHITFNKGELWYKILGTTDLDNVIVGTLFAIVGLFISLIIPSDYIASKLPPSFNAAQINGTAKRIFGGFFTSAIFLRVFGDFVASKDTTLFIVYSISVGLLSYHLIVPLVTYVISGFTKVTGITIIPNQGAIPPTPNQSNDIVNPDKPLNTPSKP